MAIKKGLARLKGREVSIHDGRPGHPPHNGFVVAIEEDDHLVLCDENVEDYEDLSHEIVAFNVIVSISVRRKEKDDPR